jgi:ATP-dependent RNA helicase RhlE
MVPSDYVHRIGRTGRAGSEGDAISLVCVDERPLLHEIERLLGGPIPTEVVPGFEPDPSARPEPIRMRSGQGGGQRREGRRMSPSHPRHAATRPQGRGPRRGPRRQAGSSIGRWVSLPGERTRR